MLISLSHLFSKSIDLCRQHIKLFATYVALAYAPSLLMTVAAFFFPRLMSDSMSVGGVVASFVVYIFFAIALSAVSFWISLAFTRVVAKRYAGESVLSIGEELKAAKPLFWLAIGVSLLSALAVAGGMLLLIIPGIIFAIWFAFSLYAVVLDGKRPIEAMKYSKSLVDGRWWAVFFRLVVPSVVFAMIVWIIADIISIPFSMMLERTNTDSSFYMTWAILSELIESLVTSLLITPLTTAVIIILFQDLKAHPHTTSPSPLPSETTPPTLQ